MPRRATVQVVYADGTEESIRLTPFSLMQAERKFGEKMPRFEGTFFAAWCSKGKPGGSFDEWAQSIDAAEEVLEGDDDPLVQEASQGE